MRFEPNDPPRTFEVGWGTPIKIKDCGRIRLDPDEQVTFVTEAGAEYDLARKDWGFYATPSLNSRLAGFGLRAVLVRNKIDRYFVLLVEAVQEPAFQRYLAAEDLHIITWLDDDVALGRLEGALDAGS